ncbi:MAG: SDR family NAD(P)-dependent oxidoreductase [Phycisphaeraceae bacterium]
MPDTILITGAAGFIGSHLTDRLLGEGHHVVGLDNFCDFYDPARKRANLTDALGQERFTLVEADLRDRAAVLAAVADHRPATLVHLAAMAGVRPSIENPALYTAVNLDGTVNLLDAAAAHAVQRVVFASSSSVYGNNTKTPFAEDDRVDHPISPYAATKKAGELLCHTYSHLYDLPITCLRFFTVFGPRQRPDLAIAKFLRRVSEGQPIPVFGDGSTSRDYTFVADIVTGITAAIDRCGQVERHRIYNLGGNAPVSLKQMIATIERVTGQPARIERQPMQPGDVQRTWADLTRAGAELDYAPTTSLEAGIARQWQWMQETR